jgi:hypothetical protein
VITRRTLLLSSSAAATALFIPPIIGDAKADTMPWASHFDYINNNDYTEVKTNALLPNMPATASNGLITANMTIPLYNRGNAIGIMNTVSFGCGSNILDRSMTCGIDRQNAFLYFWGTAACNGQKLSSYIGPHFLSPGTKCNVIWSWNGAAAKVLVNGTPVNLTYTNFNGAPEATNCNTPVTVSGQGDMTDIGLFMGGTYIDAADALDALYDIETGYARRNASTGMFIVNDRRPQVWLSGPPNKFLLNEASGDFSWPSTFNGSPTSDFVVTVGSLSVGTSDPFEPGSGE